MLMDASALVDFFVVAANTRRIRDHMAQQDEPPIISDFAAGEFASAVKRYVFMGEMSQIEAMAVFSRFDAWCSLHAQQVVTEPADVRLATAYVRRLDVRLRMPDAMYIALAHRLGVRLCSFDADQMAAARQFGIAVAEIQ